MKRILLLILLLAALPLQAATFTVTKTADTLDGACDRDCSLREAVTAANADEPAGGADVVVVPPGIYMLTRSGAGEDASATGDLDLNDQVILVGAGAGSSVLDGNGIDRVLDARAPAEIYGVTIRNGRVDGDGGGMLVRFNPAPQPVLLRRSVVSGNQAEGDGGGIAAPGYLEVRESAILENQAGGDGGGLSGVGYKLANVTVSDNRADGSGGGLAYEVGHGELISASTIVFNQAGVSGGGIRAHRLLPPGAFPAQVQGSIVADNFAPLDRDCSTTNPISLGYNVFGAATGCFPLATDKAGTDAHPLAAVFRLQDTRLGPTPVHELLLDSPALDLVAPERCEPADQLGQARSAGGNQPCDAGALERVDVPACLPGGSVLCLQEGRFRVTATLDERFPSRGAQAVPLTDSISINTGNYWFFAPDNLEVMVKVLDGCALNQRWWVFASGLTDVGVHLKVVDLATGQARTYDHTAGTTFPPRLDTDAFPCTEPGPGAGGGGVTPGSGTLQEEVFRVTRTSDSADGLCDHDCSLREAVIAANARPTTSVIVLGPERYTLTRPGRGENAALAGDLDVAERLVILGAGAQRTAIDGGGIDRVLDVRPATGSLELYDLTVRNGWANDPEPTGNEGGGGIQAFGPLRLVRSAVTQNRSELWGGGILAGEQLTVRDSTISGNSAVTFGGGLAASVVDLENLTISGNLAGLRGGGFFLPIDVARLRNVTITNNSAALGGGLAVSEPNCPILCFGPVEIERTVVAGNFAAGSPDCFEMPLFTGGDNVFGVDNGCDPGGEDESGTPSHPLDARLSPLADHGGPTLTHVPLPGSPVLDLAPANACGGTDQRGLPRPRDGGCDAGAVERQPTCEPDADTLCIGGGGAGSRFRVTVHWRAQGDDGPGKAVPLALDTGAFWFFDAANLELTVKVLDGCGVNGRFWVFLSGLTDVGVEVRVEDTATGETWTHNHAAGTALQPRLDTNALEVCP